MSDPPIAPGTETSAPPTEPRPPSAWRRLLWMLLPPGLWLAGRSVPLPGVDAEAAAFAGHVGGLRTGVLPTSITPIVSAYLAVEVVAAAVPPWRPLRHTRRGRARLVLAALVLSFVFTAAGSWPMLSALEGAGALSGSWLTPLVTLLGATALAWAALHAADRNGVGSSFALLLGLVPSAGLAQDELGVQAAGAAPGLPRPAALVVLSLLAGVATVLVLRRPAREHEAPGGQPLLSVRIPNSGFVALWVVVGLLVPGFPLLAAAGLPGADALARAPSIVWLAGLVLVVPWLVHAPSRAGAAWALLFEPGPAASPTEGGAPGPGGAAEERRAESDAHRRASTDAIYAPPAAGDGVLPSDAPGASPAAVERLSPGRAAAWTARARALLLRAMLPTVAYLAIVVWPLWPVLGRSDAPWRRIDGVAGTCLLVAALYDIVAETRFRLAHRDATCVLVEQRLYTADAAMAALSAAGIPAFTRNSGARALMSFLGPYTPMQILVPRPLAGAARERLAAILEPEPAEGRPGKGPSGGPMSPRKKVGPASGDPSRPRKRRKAEQPVAE